MSLTNLYFYHTTPVHLPVGYTKQISLQNSFFSNWSRFLLSNCWAQHDTTILDVGTFCPLSVKFITETVGLNTINSKKIKHIKIGWEIKVLFTFHIIMWNIEIWVPFRHHFQKELFFLIFSIDFSLTRF
jgi:hypothetical protein